MSDEIRPFKIHVSDADLEDLKRRLRATRWPDRQTVPDWSQGIPLDYVREICEYWARDYDWRRIEARLNALPQFHTDLDGNGIYFLHIRSPHTNAIPLILTHGWPGSVIEFLKVIPALTEPSKHGGESQDAFHVVCPALPGYGFSDKPQTAWSVQRIARAWSELMLRLGYRRYFAQGGDWGAAVTTAIALQDPEHCRGVHLNLPTIRPDPATMSSLTDEEEECLAAARHYRDWDSGYARQMSTRPQTLGYGLADSPAGQAAWILEKFWAWTDCDGNPENALTRDEMLDDITLYWLTNSAASSGRLYWESFNKLLDHEPVRISVGCSIFPKEISRVSRRWAEKGYPNLVYWNRLDRGGHFAAFEQPDLFVKELRACFRQMRAV